MQTTYKKINRFLMKFNKWTVHFPTTRKAHLLRWVADDLGSKVCVCVCVCVCVHPMVHTMTSTWSSLKTYKIIPNRQVRADHSTMAQLIISRVKEAINIWLHPNTLSDMYNWTKSFMVHSHLHSAARCRLEKATRHGIASYSHIVHNHPNHMMPGEISRSAPISWPPRSPNEMCYMKNPVYQDKNDNCQQFNAHIQGTVVTVTDNICQGQVDRGRILCGYWSCHQESSHWNLLW